MQWKKFVFSPLDEEYFKDFLESNNDPNNIYPKLPNNG